MKKLWKLLLLAGVFTVLLCGSALAEGERSLNAGFYDIDMSAVTGVTIEPQDGNGAKVTAVTAAVGSGTATYYEAERLGVTYKNAAIQAGDQFVVMLVTGNALPKDANTICYIDQDAAAAGSVAFNVYPLLPATATPMTLYITSNNGSIGTVKIPLQYATAGTYKVAPYVLGDVDSDGYWTANDALYTLQIAVNKSTIKIGGNDVEVTDIVRAAADVDTDGYVTANDASKILQKAVGKDVF